MRGKRIIKNKKLRACAQGWFKNAQKTSRTQKNFKKHYFFNVFVEKNPQIHKETRFKKSPFFTQKRQIANQLGFLFHFENIID